ncbi:tRNA lysidine(34) synthetase TilS [Alteromonas halophila]|uniref:tRNA(Ile)-lysidine synthase n=1 Tax=Alteromonas halophila TaxID=516698 RepID=A0A918JDD1_9ALTE|nr:tRNA lysidine(34) synthetase TilS [Alteromonas halophila]GGW73259.1 tRNA(Ile)-lysidine synthase [Alteromonas halophila]
MELAALTHTIENLKRLSAPHQARECHFVVALSGGLDSTLLLLATHLLCQNTEARLSAVHVHHGLSPNADSWLTHCQSLCNTLQVPFYTEQVSINVSSRTSLEAEAREARYRVLIDYCHQHQGMLLLGHHLQDQLETVLLQLKRGAGPRGLAGMGELQRRQGIAVLRPMLTLERSDIEAAVRERGFNWIDDESNQDTQYDRNFLRHQIIPALTARWPQLPQTVARSARLCAEQDAMIDEEARARLKCMTGTQNSLSLPCLREQPVLWQRAIVRVWLMQHDIAMPSYAQLEQVLSMCDARQDAQPAVTLGAHQIRRFDGALYVVGPQVAPPRTTVSVVPGTGVPLDWLDCELTVSVTDPSLAACAWSLQAGMPAIRVTPEGKGFSKPLKQWVKAWKIPAWERPGVTVLFCDKTPVAVLTPTADYRLADFTGQVQLIRRART